MSPKGDVAAHKRKQIFTSKNKPLAKPPTGGRGGT